MYIHIYIRRSCPTSHRNTYSHWQTDQHNSNQNKEGEKHYHTITSHDRWRENVRCERGGKSLARERASVLARAHERASEREREERASEWAREGERDRQRAREGEKEREIVRARERESTKEREHEKARDSVHVRARRAKEGTRTSDTGQEREREMERERARAQQYLAIIRISQTKSFSSKPALTRVWSNVSMHVIICVCPVSVACGMFMYMSVSATYQGSLERLLFWDREERENHGLKDPHPDPTTSPRPRPHTRPRPRPNPTHIPHPHPCTCPVSTQWHSSNTNEDSE